ncbi:MAG: hypothetical protein U5R31_03935 [Acidimicrobiia bacterium]|nr:hypothetical protein [Acidimicrobiia bacterium]
MNLTQLADLQRTFDARASEVDQLVADLSRLIGSGGGMGTVFWQGRLADQFRAEWDSVYVRSLRQLADALGRPAALHRRQSAAVEPGAQRRRRVSAPRIRAP